MGKLTPDVFNESCCDGGICNINKESAQSCGCDPGANWVCSYHQQKALDAGYTMEEVMKDSTPPKQELPKIRKFETGATRDIDLNKYDYEGFISPLVLDRYAAYMHKHRIQPDGSLRDSDNWQKGIPKTAYMKSGFRHFMDWWRQHRGWPGQDTLEDSLCALMFNVQGYLDTILKESK